MNVYSISLNQIYVNVHKFTPIEYNAYYKFMLIWCGWLQWKRSFVHAAATTTAMHRYGSYQLFKWN